MWYTSYEGGRHGEKEQAASQHPRTGGQIPGQGAPGTRSTQAGAAAEAAEGGLSMSAEVTTTPRIVHAPTAAELALTDEDRRDFRSLRQWEDDSCQNPGTAVIGGLHCLCQHDHGSAEHKAIH